jgi:hypothetical protein
MGSKTSHPHLSLFLNDVSSCRKRNYEQNIADNSLFLCGSLRKRLATPSRGSTDKLCQTPTICQLQREGNKLKDGLRKYIYLVQHIN